MKISVVVCTRNRPTQLADCMDALSKQVHPADEVIVVDDTSSNASQSVAGRYGARHLRQTGNGLAQARNQGLAEARGDVIAFIDDDCVASSNWLAVMEDIFRRFHPGVVGGYWFTRNPTSWVARCFGYRYDIKMRTATEGIVSHLPGCNMAVSRDAVRALHGFDEELQAADDVDFCYRASLAGYALYFSPSLVVHHAERDNLRSLSQQHYVYGLGAARATRKHWRRRLWVTRYGWRVTVLPVLWALGALAALLSASLWWLLAAALLILPAWALREALRYRSVLQLPLLEVGRCVVVGIAFRLAFLIGFYYGLAR